MFAGKTRPLEAPRAGGNDGPPPLTLVYIIDTGLAMGTRVGDARAVGQTCLDAVRLALLSMLRPGADYWMGLLSRRVRVFVVDAGEAASFTPPSEPAAPAPPAAATTRRRPTRGQPRPPPAGAAPPPGKVEEQLASVHRRSLVYESQEFRPNTNSHAQALAGLWERLHGLAPKGASHVGNALSAMAFALNSRHPHDGSGGGLAAPGDRSEHPPFWDSYPTGSLVGCDPLNNAQQASIAVFTTTSLVRDVRTTPTVPSPLVNATPPEDVLHWKQLINVIVLRRPEQQGLTVASAGVLQAAAASGGVVFDLPSPLGGHSPGLRGGLARAGPTPIISAVYHATLRAARQFFTAVVEIDDGGAAHTAPSSPHKAQSGPAEGGGPRPGGGAARPEGASSSPAPATGGDATRLPPAQLLAAYPPPPATVMFYPLPSARTTTWPLLRVAQRPHPGFVLRHSARAGVADALRTVPADRCTLEADLGTAAVSLRDAIFHKLTDDGGAFVVSLKGDDAGSSSSSSIALNRGDRATGLITLDGNVLIFSILPAGFPALCYGLAMVHTASASPVPAGRDALTDALTLNAIPPGDPRDVSLPVFKPGVPSLSVPSELKRALENYAKDAPQVMVVALNELLAQSGALPIDVADGTAVNDRRVLSEEAARLAAQVYRCTSVYNSVRVTPAGRDLDGDGGARRPPAVAHVNPRPDTIPSSARRKRKWCSSARDDIPLATKLARLRDHVSSAHADEAMMQAMHTSGPSGLAEARHITDTPTYRDLYHMVYADRFTPGGPPTAEGAAARGGAAARRPNLGVVGAVQLAAIDGNYHCHPNNPSHSIPVRHMSDQGFPPRRAAEPGLREVPSTRRPPWLVNNHAASKFKALKPSVRAKYEPVDPRSDETSWMLSEVTNSSLPASDVDGLSLDGLPEQWVDEDGVGGGGQAPDAATAAAAGTPPSVETGAAAAPAVP